MKRRILASCLLGASLACQSAEDAPAPQATPGISRELARHRAATLSDLRYAVSFSVPDAPDEPIRGHETVRFVRARGAGPLILDFAAPPTSVLAVRVSDPAADAPAIDVSYRVGSGHITVPAEALRDGENAVEVEFLAGEGSLNRQADFLYTLFVPDRAHHAFPCFDQPDMKARFSLSLELPAAWEAVANASLVEHTETEGRRPWTFAETAPLSTYLFAFAAGVFQVEEAAMDGRTMRMLHRETDAEKLAANRDTVFELHAGALAWLEDYTAIPYPFEKFDFVLVPDFQYGGMEHPGAITYRASRLLLDASATQDDHLGRASLIAHETAHMWFGDLVTMTWFDDVWMKEVFANFMAAKIAHPTFPEIDHDLSFLLDHFPSAYGIDRSAGTHPIRQELDNLREAGTLYGAIIYQKAPIVMRHLETLTGEDGMRAGLRDYLDRHRYGNASWDDLVMALRPHYPADLKRWSEVWVGEGGRPRVTVALESAEGAITSLRLAQEDPGEAGRLWSQQLEIAMGHGGGVKRLDILLEASELEVEAARGLPTPDYVLPNGGALGYGRFVLDPKSRDYLLEHLASLPDVRLRAVAWLTLWEEMLDRTVPPAALFRTALTLLEHEEEALLVERVLADVGELFWRFLAPASRTDAGAKLEDVLRRRLDAAAAASLKASFYRAWVATATSTEAVARMRELWRQELEIPGLPLSEDDITTLALELAVRGVDGAAEILDTQLSRLENPDRHARFAFIRPALVAEEATRDTFFASLADAANRAREPWVLDALTYLHHPLRAAEAEKHVRPALEGLEEIQKTGDIFFPKRWLDATLGGHRSAETAAVVRQFLEERPAYPPRLRAKILQSAEGLFRAAAIDG